MNSYFFHAALLPDGWQHNVRVTVADGHYQSIAVNQTLQAKDQPLTCVIPQMPNVHSHVFQRAMAGLSEYRSASEDDFWSWRELMYRLANEMDADRLYQVAKSCYSEMKRAGYGSVCEFHYLHRAKQDPTDYLTHSKVILKAADEVGLNLTLLPVLYAYAGPDKQALSPQQKRFELSVEEYLDLFKQLQGELSVGQKLGVCFHSLRAVSQDQMHQVIAALPDDLPIHIHIAEQQAEIDAIKAQYGQRPVAWLYQQFAVNSRWCLVHATHLNDQEIDLIAQSGAVAGICPLTEANLGDGIFPMPAYMAAGGALAIGSDSHIEINPANELKMLEYSQRLALQKRNVCCDTEQTHVGTWLWLKAVAGGAQVSAQPVSGIAVGQKAVVIDLHGRQQAASAQVLDGWIFSDLCTGKAIDL
ncbi:formimidoylglutamate deiminase [Marinicella litoralis]|uniref:Formimidoylglutamate deiminase n=1 Tax=Marinicella litoralis TaxID=644220 RepID=A0A4R6XLC0_9GAMM|nr:formimidoylglutamate deiminase [Marinicella litoralis]TDR20402.1 formimidoylglutamate deiminase [Marinicella litoralis]